MSAKSANGRRSSEGDRKLPSSEASTAAAKAELAKSPQSPIDANPRSSISSPPISSPELLQHAFSSADTSKINKPRMRRYSSEITSSRGGIRPSYLSFQRGGLFQRRQSSGEAAQGSRELVELYETAKSPTLQQHGHFKHTKWGEGEMCDVDFDISDVNMSVSLTDAIKIFPITDSLAQCVKSYSAFLRRLTIGYNHEVKAKTHTEPPSLSRQPYSGSIDLVTSSPLSSSPDVLSPSHTPSSSCNLSPSSPDALSPSRLHSDLDGSSNLSPISRFLSNASPGDLFMPRSVQEAFDFAWMMSRSASQAVDFCPRRKRRSNKSSTREACPNVSQDRRQRRRSRTTPCPNKSSPVEPGSDVQQSNPDECYNPDLGDSSSSEDERSSCGPSAAFRVCPRRRPKKTSCVRSSFFGRF